MKFTIAGANSFIGKRLLKKLTGDEVVAIVREGSTFTHPGVNIVQSNMDSYDKLGELCGTGDVFIDLTWKGSRGADRQDEVMQRMNYESTLAAMKSMIDAGYKTIVSAGSQAEYGQVEDVITEDTPANPNTQYGIYKIKIFNEVREMAQKAGVRFLEPRYFSLYGPGDYDKTLIMATLHKLINNQKVELNECTQLWDYMFVDDAMDALIHLCKTDAESGVYNFATGKHKTLREFILEMKDAIGSTSQIIFGAVPYNGLYIDLNPDVSKLKNTGWTQRTSFDEGIRITAEYLRKAEKG